jgi:hypothetical protein
MKGIFKSGSRNPGIETMPRCHAIDNQRTDDLPQWRRDAEKKAEGGRLKAETGTESEAV